MPEDFNVALGGIKQAEQQLDRGRFAGAVRPEQAEHLAAADLKIHVIDSARLGAAPEILEDLGQPADGYNRLGGFEIGAGRLRGDLGGGHGINFQVWRPRERFPPNPLFVFVFFATSIIAKYNSHFEGCEYTPFNARNTIADATAVLLL